MTEIKKCNLGMLYESPELFDVSLIESESVALSSPSDWADPKNFKFNNTYDVANRIRK